MADPPLAMVRPARLEIGEDAIGDLQVTGAGPDPQIGRALAVIVGTAGCDEAEPLCEIDEPVPLARRVAAIGRLDPTEAALHELADHSGEAGAFEPETVGMGEDRDPSRPLDRRGDLLP